MNKHPFWYSDGTRWTKRAINHIIYQCPPISCKSPSETRDPARLLYPVNNTLITLYSFPFRNSKFKSFANYHFDSMPPCECCSLPHPPHASHDANMMYLSLPPASTQTPTVHCTPHQDFTPNHESRCGAAEVTSRSEFLPTTILVHSVEHMVPTPTGNFILA